MPEKSPLEHLVEELTSLLEFVQDNQSKGIPEGRITPEITSQVERLEKEMEELRAQTEEAIGDATEVSSDKLPRREKRVLEKTDMLRSEFSKLRRAFGVQKTLAKKSKLKYGGSGKRKKFGKARQKKFRRIGGKKGWKPL